MQTLVTTLRNLKIHVTNLQKCRNGSNSSPLLANREHHGSKPSKQISGATAQGSPRSSQPKSIPPSYAQIRNTSIKLWRGAESAGNAVRAQNQPPPLNAFQPHPSPARSAYAPPTASMPPAESPHASSKAPGSLRLVSKRVKQPEEDTSAGGAIPRVLPSAGGARAGSTPSAWPVGEQTKVVEGAERDVAAEARGGSEGGEVRAREWLTMTSMPVRKAPVGRAWQQAQQADDAAGRRVSFL